jgi:hypothetical protein
MKPIKFKKHFRGYNPGEVAHFDHELADRLIQTERAEAVETANTTETTPASAAREKPADKSADKAAPKVK